MRLHAYVQDSQPVVPAGEVLELIISQGGPVTVQFEFFYIGGEATKTCPVETKLWLALFAFKPIELRFVPPFSFVTILGTHVS